MGATSLGGELSWNCTPACLTLAMTIETCLEVFRFVLCSTLISVKRHYRRVLTLREGEGGLPRAERGMIQDQLEEKR